MKMVQSPKRASELIGCALLLMMFLLFLCSLFTGVIANGFLSVIVNIAAKILIFGIPIGIILLAVRRGRLSLHETGELPPRNRRWLTVLSSIGVIILLQMLYGSVFPSALTQIGLQKDTAAGLFVLLFLLHVLIPAFTEEIFFRGIMQRSMKVFRASLSILMSAVAFALMHFSVEFFPIAFVCGLVLGLAYSFTGSLTATIGIHACCNAFWFVSEAIGVYFAESYAVYMRICLTMCVLLASFGLPFLKENMLSVFSDGEENTEPSSQFWTMPMILFFIFAIGVQLITQAL